MGGASHFEVCGRVPGGKDKPAFQASKPRLPRISSGKRETGGVRGTGGPLGGARGTSNGKINLGVSESYSVPYATYTRG